MDHERGQISRAAAEVYEEFFVPALFRPWASRVADLVSPRAGEYVLDVACGTGVLARELAERVGAAGRVVGLDTNPEMLSVASRNDCGIEWKLGRAEELPFDDATFDAVVSQFGLMFFDDRPSAIAEMMRVLKPGGRFAVAVWSGIEDAPAYAAISDLLGTVVGPEAAGAIRAPFVLGDPAALQRLFPSDRAREMKVRKLDGAAQFPSIAAWMHTEIRGWTLADDVDEAQFATLQNEAEKELRQFVGDDGSVMFPMPACVVTGTRN